jgi:hypothetical protein
MSPKNKSQNLTLPFRAAPVQYPLLAKLPKKRAFAYSKTPQL